MANLKEALISEGHSGRSEPISKERFEEIKESKASVYSFGDGKIFRGIRGFGYDFAKIDPAPHKERKSSYAQTNYYTLIINNSFPWRRYPKRELSCTTSSTKAAGYGDVYLVIPYDGIKWGVCPDKDIFFSFGRLQKEAGFESIDRFMSVIRSFFREYLNSVPSENDFTDFKFHLEKLGDKLAEIGFFEDSYSDMLKDGFENLWEPYQDSKFYEYNEFDQFVFDLVDPEKNDFEMQETWNGAPDNREVWTDGPCLLVRIAFLKENPGELDL